MSRLFFNGKSQCCNTAFTYIFFILLAAKTFNKQIIYIYLAFRHLFCPKYSFKLVIF